MSDSSNCSQEPPVSDFADDPDFAELLEVLVSELPQCISAFEAAATDEERETGPFKILIVDDDPMYRMLSRFCLSEAGHEIVEAESGEACLDMISVECPDVVIMDVVMPGMDGLECTRRLKSLPSAASIPIIILSGRTESDAIAQGFDAGANEYITKSIHPRELVIRVESLARSFRKTRMLRRRADDPDAATDGPDGQKGAQLAQVHQ